MFAGGGLSGAAGSFGIMRTKLALPLLALAALGLMAAPAVLADGGDHANEKADKGQSKAAAMRAAHAHAQGSYVQANDTEDVNETGQRPAHVTAFLNRMSELRDAWRNDTAALREQCRAAAIDHENATKEERLAWAHCVRDGYRALRMAWHEDMRDARDEFRTAREAWREERAAARAANADARAANRGGNGEDNDTSDDA